MENDPNKWFQNQVPQSNPQPNVTGQPNSPAQAVPPAAPTVTTQPVMPVVVSPDVPPAPVAQAPAPQPDAPLQTQYSQQQTTPQEAPKIKLYSIAGAGFGVSITLAIFLPNSRAAQLLYIPILVFGGAGAVIFLVESVRASMKKSNVGAKLFLIFGGVSIGFVIFIISAIAALVVDGAKDPHPPPPS